MRQTFAVQSQLTRGKETPPLENVPVLVDRAVEAEAIERLLAARKPDLVPYEGWREIDRHERSHGERQGRPRVKLTRIEEMLRVAAAETPEPGE